MLLIGGVTIFVITTTFVGLYITRLELDSAKRIIVAEMEKSNTVNLKDIEEKIEKDFKAKKIAFVQMGPIKFAYGDNQNKGGNLKESDSGYYGRSLELVIYRDMIVGWIKKPIRISTGVSTVNKNVMEPTKDVEYRVGEEFLNGN